MSSHSAPIDVLGMLHAYFSKLDAMVDSLGAYKASWGSVGEARPLMRLPGQAGLLGWRL